MGGGGAQLHERNAIASAMSREGVVSGSVGGATPRNIGDRIELCLFGATEQHPTARRALPFTDTGMARSRNDDRLAVHASALKAAPIGALGKIPGTEAETKLEALARSEDVILRKTAEEQL